VLQTFNIEHIMNKQTTFVTYCTFAENSSLVIVTVGYMTIWLERNADEPGCITCHMF